MASPQGRGRSFNRFTLISIGIFALVLGVAAWVFLTRDGKLGSVADFSWSTSPGDWQTVVYDKVLDERLRVGVQEALWIRKGDFADERAGFSDEWSSCQVAMMSAVRVASPLSPVAARQTDRDGKPLKCPNLLVVETPVRASSMTIHVRRGSDLLDWFEKNPSARTFFDSSLGKGFFEGALEIMRVRAEDLKVEGVTGPIVSSILTSLLENDFRLHWSPVKGSRSIAVSFAKAGTASTLLSTVVKVTERVGYVIEGLEGRVSEILFGGRTLYFHEDASTIRVSMSLYGLIDALVTPRDPALQQISGSVALEIRAESIIGNMLETVVGSGASTWPLWVGFDLGATKSDPTEAWIGPSRLGTMLTQKVPMGVVRSIPHDVFAAAWFGIRLPERLPEESWSKLASGSLDFAASGRDQGIAVLWDLEAEVSPKVSSMGVVVATGSDDMAADLAAIWFDPALTARCTAGVVIAATTPSLLTRMTESCNRRSMSVADWKDSPLVGVENLPRLGVFVNPVVGLWQSWLAGEVKGSETAPRNLPASMKSWSEKLTLARAKLRQDVQRDVKNLSVVGWTSTDAAAENGSIHLKGFVSKWEHAL